MIDPDNAPTVQAPNGQRAVVLQWPSSGRMTFSVMRGDGKPAYEIPVSALLMPDGEIKFYSYRHGKSGFDESLLEEESD